MLYLDSQLGEKIYTSFHPQLFYISCFVIAISLIKTLTSDKQNIGYLIAQICASAFILFLIKFPLKFLEIGNILFNAFMGILNEIKL